MISSLLHLVGLRPRVYYTLTNFRGGGGQGPLAPPQYANESVGSLFSRTVGKTIAGDVAFYDHHFLVYSEHEWIYNNILDVTDSESFVDIFLLSTFNVLQIYMTLTVIVHHARAPRPSDVM